MAFVLDASIALSWALEDEENATADEALRRLDREKAHVPVVWWYEIRNALLTNERRQRISEQDTAVFLRALSAMNIETAGFPADSVILALARDHRLTIYDASYLELALREVLPLATLDKQLALAARCAGVALIG